MDSVESRDSFDKLVAGLSTEDRLAMLNRINQSAAQTSHLKTPDDVLLDTKTSLRIRLNNESVFYKFILWLRSVFQKNSVEQLYGEDLLAGIARKVNKDHPGVVNHKIKSLDYIFYERLLSLKDSADFFKPYLSFIEENPGDFYVFLSSFVVPELTEQINNEVDPFSNEMSVEPSPELRTELVRKLDDILKNMDPSTKNRMYASVTSINWLQNFANLPYLHFIAQFTNVAGSIYSCTYKHAVLDYNQLASVFYNVLPIQNEVLEALYLFSQRKSMTTNTQDKDIEEAVRDFLGQAATHLATVQSFINGVPVLKVGRIVNSSYDWQADPIEGAEAWFPNFRSQWRSILDIRWNEWLREKKKVNLSSNLKSDFGMTEFPVLPCRPWLKIWSRVQFDCELTGGFLAWLCTEKYSEIQNYLNIVTMEGIFIRSENRTEFSEGFTNMNTAMSMMSDLMLKLEQTGDFGKVFEEFAGNKMHTFQIQKQIDAMMKSIESTIREAMKIYIKGARNVERVFHGFFDEERDGIHETLQNLNQIKGRENHHFKEALKDIRDLLNKSIFYLGELEPIDSTVN